MADEKDVMTGGGERISESAPEPNTEPAESAQPAQSAGVPEMALEKKDNSQAAEQNYKEYQKRARRKAPLIKRMKWYHIVAAFILLFVIVLFVGWHVMPKRAINVAVLDKTILSYSEDERIIKETVYRKHEGFFWILTQQRYVKSDKTYYDPEKDYYGPMLDEEGAYDHTVDLRTVTELPDLLYISDAYGLENDTFGYYNSDDPAVAGFSADDMSVATYAYENGATIIGEMTLFSSPLSDSVRAQLVSMLGVTPTTWLGRYIFDLQDFTDVPDWAPPMYEQQEGVEWRFTGPGILLVSEEGRIIILEQNTDFNSKNLLRIYMNDEYKKEFSGCSKCNFYNWFELVEANFGTESLATFEFDLNATGMEKISEVSNTPRFVAVTRRVDENHAPVYYFAGDFNDYTSGRRYGKFLLANQIYKLFSYDRQGDITNFFWNFYDPFIRHVLKDTRSRAIEREESEAEPTEASRVRDGTFQVLSDGKWRDITVHAVSVNAKEPGKENYPRDFDFYDNLVKNAVELGANCINAKTLLPPEFYSAVYTYNRNNADNDIYILQTIPTPDGLSAPDFTSQDGLAAWSEITKATVSALHGDGSASVGLSQAATYFTDVSEYLLGYVFDAGLDDSASESLDDTGYLYSGTTVTKQSGVEGFAAFLYDTAQSYSLETYGVHTPIAIRSEMKLVDGTDFGNYNSKYNFKSIAADDCKEYLFNDVTFDASLAKRAEYNGLEEYDAFREVFVKLRAALPDSLISGISYSNVNAVFGQKAMTEREQGEHIVSAVGAADDAETLGSVVFDLNDRWDTVARSMRRYTVPESGSLMWHNTCDPTETTGLVALESPIPAEPGLVLSHDDRVQRISLSSNAEYVFITIQLLMEIDFKSEAFFVGIDTYQRNDGEYYYSSQYTPTSLSGMEYVLHFTSKQDATLGVIPTYDRSRGTAYTAESYTGSYDTVANLTYGGFNSADNQFYQTGSTIYVRIPWTWFNVTDPSKKLVLSDASPRGDQAETVTTNGILVSVMLGNVIDGDLLYAFPETKHDPGYKVFKWNTWEKVEYVIRQKESFKLLSEYYAKN